MLKGRHMKCFVNALYKGMSFRDLESTQGINQSALRGVRDPYMHSTLILLETMEGGNSDLRTIPARDCIYIRWMWCYLSRPQGNIYRSTSVFMRYYRKEVTAAMKRRLQAKRLD